ncbi:reprolysin-like metallopeptidase [Aquimarina sp. RZ0]|uniref:zinc-dependent metalloprotease n=1 Tax=Aquimarina sp. RZ0 TaxID=2607730 RepID=UPI0011F21CF3|nr:zinc-dependent metalloprotease family protein [Aquimarina sp. RZ0]KAA1242834.1 T9SS type A sorting domain-containing protein [Aquimarina sp. RZ0]
MKTNLSLLILCLILVSPKVLAQQRTEIWKSVSSQKTSTKEKQVRKTTPAKFQLFSLETEKLKSVLKNAPSRSLQKTSDIILELPTKDGILKKFKIFEASVLSKELGYKFPDIKSYVGQGIDDPTATARFSISKIGFHGMIFSGKHGAIFIDPYTKDKKEYISYAKADLPALEEGFTCLVEDSYTKQFITNPAIPITKNANDGKLRTFRLALACTGEYAQFHINNQGVNNNASDQEKKEAVLSAMNTTMTRVNGVFEIDLALTMIIVPNNDEIIFLDAQNDGFSNNDGGEMLYQNQQICDDIITSSNYDIGHVFSTGGGGVALLGSPCSRSKASGVTGGRRPIGDPFDMDFVAHEMGHQYGGNHTQNNNCQRSRASVEPGSASTIMGYAGICSPNVQRNGDTYFHAISIQEMWNFIANGSGTCSTKTDTNNVAPTAEAGADYTLPASTPFILKGNGSDTDGDNLTYCWEQMDPEPAPMPPVASSTKGPAFRSLSSTVSGDRYMPTLSTVLDGNSSSEWEVVPSVSRTMNFRLTVRDNYVNGASSASDNMVVTIDGDSGPFVVTSQDNELLEWEGGTTEMITWDVANTDQAPVNAQEVDIMLSIDGGQTFTTVLKSTTPNDGSEEIVVPNVGDIERARIMVIGSGSIFYNVNAANFKINRGSILSVNEVSFKNFSLWPNPSYDIFNVSFDANFSENISMQLHTLQGKLVDQKIYKNLTTNHFSETFDYSSLSAGMYFMTIKSDEIQATYSIIKK